MIGFFLLIAVFGSLFLQIRKFLFGNSSQPQPNNPQWHSTVSAEASEDRKVFADDEGEYVEFEEVDPQP